MVNWILYDLEILMRLLDKSFDFDRNELKSMYGLILFLMSASLVIFIMGCGGVEEDISNLSQAEKEIKAGRSEAEARSFLEKEFTEYCWDNVEGTATALEVVSDASFSARDGYWQIDSKAYPSAKPVSLPVSTGKIYKDGLVGGELMQLISTKLCSPLLRDNRGQE